MADVSTREWQPTGNLAENYERYGVPVIFRPWALNLIDRSGLKPGERVLDVGCGTGIVTRLALERVGGEGKVVGIDLLPPMLDVARSVAPPDAPVEWRQSSADALPFDDETFDAVLCQQALQFFPDKPAALREMHRVLVPDGRLTVSVWQDLERIPGYAAVADALATHVGPAPAAFVQLICGLGSADDLRSVVEEAGFRDLAIDSVTKDYQAATVEEFVWQLIQMTPLSANPSVGQADDPTRAAVVSDVAARLEPYVSDEGLAFPLVANVATARK